MTTGRINQVATLQKCHVEVSQLLELSTETGVSLGQYVCFSTVFCRPYVHAAIAAISRKQTIRSSVANSTYPGDRSTHLSRATKKCARPGAQ